MKALNVSNLPLRLALCFQTEFFFSNRDGGTPQILADQLTLFQPGGAGFSGLLRQRSIRRHGVIDVARYNSVTFYVQSYVEIVTCFLFPFFIKYYKYSHLPCEQKIKLN